MRRLLWIPIYSFLTLKLRKKHASRNKYLQNISNVLLFHTYILAYFLVACKKEWQSVDIIFNNLPLNTTFSSTCLSVRPSVCFVCLSVHQSVLSVCLPSFLHKLSHPIYSGQNTATLSVIHTHTHTHWARGIIYKGEEVRGYNRLG